jgi:hypothetical protein
MSVRDFHKLLKQHKCTWEQKGDATHFYIKDETGKVVSTFSVQKRTNVLYCYVHNFKKAMGLK